MLQIVPAVSSDQLEQTAQLLQELMAWDLQNVRDMGFETDTVAEFYYEHHPLPGEFAPPDGRLIMALYDGDVAGGIALRRLDERSCEIKRMYVRPQFRGKKIGRALGERLIQEAREIGYARVCLETVSFMRDAHALYYALGFKDVEPYYEIPDEWKPITRFMELNL